MTRIMVPLDGSPFAEEALEYAAQLAWRMKATLDLVRVHVPLGRGTQPDRILFTLAGRAAHQKRREGYYLDALAHGLRGVGLDVATTVLTGPIAPVLSTRINQAGVDLVVMATHGRSGLGRVWLGSVADQLVCTTLAPVLLLRPLTNNADTVGLPCELDRVLVAIDGSTVSNVIIEDVCTLLGPTARAGVTLLHVTDTPYLRNSSVDYLEQVALPLEKMGFSVETRLVAHPDVATAIVELASARNAGLIAMSTRGLGNGARIEPDSVAAQVLRRTRIPLLLRRQSCKEDHHNGRPEGLRNFGQPLTETASATG